MKKQLTLIVLVAAALVAAPASLRAEGETDKGPQAEKHQSAKKQGVTPFRGKVAAVDAAAKTLTVGKTVINVTADTKITKHGKEATFADIVVGEKVGGAYKKDDTGNKGTTINIGEKPDKAEKAEKGSKKSKKADNQ